MSSDFRLSPNKKNISNVDSEYSEMNELPDPSDFRSGSGDLKDILLKDRNVSFLRVLEDLLKEFSPSERLILYALTVLLASSTLFLVLKLNNFIMTTVPAPGGSLTEGEVGPARFVNPVLSVSQPDQDLTALIYSGLMRALPNGSLVPDLASSYEISEDGTTYTYHLRPDAVFQDNTSVTASDIAFTVAAAQNAEVKSSRRADWDGVQVAVVDTHTVQFKLAKAYAPFVYNTTLGILPKHLWQNISPEEFPFSTVNTHPIGSGPYKITSVETDQTGAAIKYTLEPFKKYTLGAPYLSHLTFLFYPNDGELVKAFNAGTISAIAGVTPADLPLLKRADTVTRSITLPRVYGVFFNQNHAPVLADASVREALDEAIDKDELVQRVLSNFGTALDNPIPPGVISNSSAPHTDISSTTTDRLASAKAILVKGGWVYDDSTGLWMKKKQALSFTLATAGEPELSTTAHEIANTWKKVGIDVKVQVYSLSELNTNVIRPRAYDAILFGEVIGREGDFFAFWHSSQRNDPGLNLAMYANSKTDALLAQARTSTDQKNRDELYKQFATLVQKDSAAVFLFAPKFIYVIPRSLHGVELGALTTPAERYLNVYDWYIDTQNVWSIFAESIR